MRFLLGTKDGMTQIFDAAGVCHGATVLRVSPLTVTAILSVDTHGYDAVQVAVGEQKESRLSKADRNHQGGLKRHVKEFRFDSKNAADKPNLESGAVVDASIFTTGDKVVVSAISKGKGFQGVVKRHGFAGDKASHGRKHSMRAPGSIGGGGRGGGKVAKGKRMAGRMGGDRITVKNLTVLQVNKDENLILVKGAVPGRKGTLVEIREMSVN